MDTLERPGRSLQTGLGRRLLRTIVTLALLVSITAAMPAQQQVAPPPETSEELFALARDMFASARQPDSIALFSRLITRLELAAPETLSAGEHQLITDSLYFRARASLNIGDESTAREDLRSLLSLEPGFAIERQLVSPKLVELFDDIRNEVVGELQLSIVPQDATILLDGTLVGNAYSIISTSAGTHALRVERPGYAPDLREIRVPAAQLSTIQIELERVSAVLRLHTRPGATRVLIDGIDAGTTTGVASPELRLSGESARYAPTEFSAALLLEDVRPGTHRVELSAEGYRPHIVDIDITDLADVDLGAIALEPLQGTLALVALPTEANVTLDGQPARLRERPLEGEALPATDLAPGEYLVTVTGAAGNVFESVVTIEDSAVTRLVIDMRPSVAFLGVLGEDTVGADTISSALEAQLAQVPEWMFLDRSSVDRGVLRQAGLGVDTLRRLGQLASPDSADVTWPDVQSAIVQAARGSVYLLAVLSDDLLATHVDLWLWPAPPGPATPDRVRLPLDDTAAIAEFIRSLQAPFGSTVPYFGAVLVDSNAAQGPVVFDVSANSPAAAAGLQPGDVVVSVGRDTADTAAQVRGWLAEKPVDAPVELILLRGGATTRTTVRMETGPSVVPGGLSTIAYSAVWAASMAQLDDPEATLPRWVAELNIANVLMQARYWDEAVRRLRGIQVPADSAFARAMVDYQMGVALEAIGPQYLELARAAYTRAASVDGARLWHRDGPYLVPRAQARLATLGGPVTAR